MIRLLHGNMNRCFAKRLSGLSLRGFHRCNSLWQSGTVVESTGEGSCFVVCNVCCTLSIEVVAEPRENEERK